MHTLRDKERLVAFLYAIGNAGGTAGICMITRPGIWRRLYAGIFGFKDVHKHKIKRTAKEHLMSLNCETIRDLMF